MVPTALYSHFIVRCSVQGMLRLDGRIEADGGEAPKDLIGHRGGGGSGGSVIVNASEL